MLPSLWDAYRRSWHAEENLGQELSVPTMKKRLFPTPLHPSDDFDQGDKAVQGVGARSPVTDGEEEPGQGSGSTQTGKPR